MKNREKVIGLVVASVILAIAVVAIVIGRSGGSDDIVGKPAEVVKQGEPATVTMETSEGTFKIDLDTEQNPITANNFASLTEKGFYDGLDFHRIVPGFVIQGGDPTGTGNGGPGYKVVEAPPADTKYEVGVVAMAKTGPEAPGTSGSQFFVVIGPQGQTLTPDYAVVGKVSEGMDVVQKIGKLDGAAQPPTIDKATLQKG